MRPEAGSRPRGHCYHRVRQRRSGQESGEGDMKGQKHSNIAPTQRRSLRRFLPLRVFAREGDVEQNRKTQKTRGILKMEQHTFGIRGYRQTLRRYGVVSSVGIILVAEAKRAAIARPPCAHLRCASFKKLCPAAQQCMSLPRARNLHLSRTRSKRDAMMCESS